jgi:uncharacterized protein
MNKSMSLFLLQNIDTKMDQIQARRKAINTLLADHSAEDSARSQESAVRANRTATEQDLSTLEKKIQTTRIKLQQSESSLYGGKIQSPKELQDLENEIKLLKANIAQFETQQFILLLEIEQKQFSESSLGQSTHDREQEYQQQSIILQSELQDLQKSEEKNLAERKALTTGIDPAMLQIYEKLRSSKSGLAVTGVEDDACMACGAEVPPAEWQRARISSELCYCYTCGRILYAK